MKGRLPRTSYRERHIECSQRVKTAAVMGHGVQHAERGIHVHSAGEITHEQELTGQVQDLERLWGTGGSQEVAGAVGVCFIEVRFEQNFGTRELGRRSSE